MQRMLPHKQARTSRQDAEPTHDDKNPPHSLHVIPLHDSLQLERQARDLVEVLPDSIDDALGVRHAAVDAPVQFDSEEVLEGGGRDGEADDGAGGAEGEAGGRDDRLMLLLDGADESDEGSDEDAAEAEAEEGEVEEWVGGRGARVQGRRERCGEDEEGVGAFVEVVIVACGFHDEACAEGADGATGAEGDES